MIWDIKDVIQIQNCLNFDNEGVQLLVGEQILTHDSFKVVFARFYRSVPYAFEVWRES